MHALSIRQPWATAIALGLKDIENRTWPPYDGAIGQLVALHAARTIDDAGAPRCRQLALRTFHQRGQQPHFPFTTADVNPVTYPTGCIIAVARLVRVITDSKSPWFEKDHYGWVFEDPTPIRPIQTSGRLGLWQLPPGVESEILRRMAEVQAKR